MPSKALLRLPEALRSAAPAPICPLRHPPVGLLRLLLSLLGPFVVAELAELALFVVAAPAARAAALLLPAGVRQNPSNHGKPPGLHLLLGTPGYTSARPLDYCRERSTVARMCCQYLTPAGSCCINIAVDVGVDIYVLVVIEVDAVPRQFGLRNPAAPSDAAGKPKCRLAAL